MKRKASTLRVIIFVLACLSCAPQPIQYSPEPSPKIVTELQGEHLAVENVTPDAGMEQMIVPFRVGLLEQMQEVLTQSNGYFYKKRPESPIGNLLSDLMRRRAMFELRTYVHVALQNYGGIRNEISEGSVSLGVVFEVMPFENTLVVLQLSGTDLQALIEDVARRGGEPVSGVRFTIRDDKPFGVLVGSEPLDEQKTYLLATNNFVADGGDRYAGIPHALKRMETGLLLRDVFVDALSQTESIDPYLDGRIRSEE